jgi:hypothetical protein
MARMGVVMTREELAAEMERIAEWGTARLGGWVADHLDDILAALRAEPDEAAVERLAEWLCNRDGNSWPSHQRDQREYRTLAAAALSVARRPR